MYRKRHDNLSQETMFLRPRDVGKCGQSNKRDLEGKLDAECTRNVGIKFYETELRREAKDLCRKVYGRPSIASASAEERIAIARCLWQNRRTYSVSSLSRVMLVSKNILQAMLLIEK